ncbi:MAG: hypothetical protein AAF355_04725 [Myxococcota bacterium]
MRTAQLFLLGAFAISCTSEGTAIESSPEDPSHSERNAPLVETPKGGCFSASDCDDGDACNGAETCDNEVCTAGTSACDDGIDCTEDLCTDSGGTVSCEFSPNNGRCGPGQTCSRLSGCAQACSVDTCKLAWPQCGCSPGDACVVGSGGARACVGRGDKHMGEPCAESAQCDAGFACHDVDVGYAGACTPYCESDGDCPTSVGTRCVVPFELFAEQGEQIAGIRVCSFSCDPVNDENNRSTPGRVGKCPADTKCDVYTSQANGSAVHHTDCRGTIGTGTAGAGCSTHNDCASEHRCVSGSCRRYCVTQGFECAPGELCQPLSPGTVTFSGVTLGTCQ